MLKLFVCLAVVNGVLSEAENSNLRGNSAVSENNILDGPSASSSTVNRHSKHHSAGTQSLFNQEKILKTNEDSVHKLIEKFEAKLLAGDESLSTKGILETVDASYQHFVVSRTRVNEDCNSPVASLVAFNLACRKQSESQSIQMFCSNSTSMSGYVYNSPDCSGEYMYSTSEDLYPCKYGYGQQCITSSSKPEFADKEGLFTYKFNDYGSCNAFANSALNYNALYADDEIYFDDKHDDDTYMDDETPCCMPSEMLDFCPFDLCPNNDDVGEGVVARHLREAPAAQTTTPSTTRDASQAPEKNLRPARWWESKAKTNAHRAAAKSSKAASSVQSAQAAAKSVQSAAAELQSIPEDMWYREYALTQQRNNVCVFDAKYRLYVKTACHGKRNTLNYEVYADNLCTRLVSKAEHRLDDALPHYGKCVKSSKRDGRFALVVCNNKDGVAPPFGNNNIAE